PNEPIGAKGFNAATKRERFLCPFVRDPQGPQALENTYKYRINLSSYSFGKASIYLKFELTIFTSNRNIHFSVIYKVSTNSSFQQEEELWLIA
ncbi:MAG: hypothetical protein LBQ88_16910, partial [Treponema sp.]|nr:hypothetical protein [Treponema sp.]